MAQLTSRVHVTSEHQSSLEDLLSRKVDPYMNWKQLRPKLINGGPPPSYLYIFNLSRYVMVVGCNKK